MIDEPRECVCYYSLINEKYDDTFIEKAAYDALKAERDRMEEHWRAACIAGEQLKQANEKLREGLSCAKGQIIGSIEGHYFLMNKEYLAKAAVQSATVFIDKMLAEADELEGKRE